jgi:hypothetical protein
MLNNTLNGWRPAITKIVGIALAIYTLSVCLPVLAAAFSVDSKLTCGPTIEVRDALVENDEQIIATGKVSDEVLMTFWANKAEEWTIVITNKSSAGTSCVVLYGDGLRTLKPRAYL